MLGLLLCEAFALGATPPAADRELRGEWVWNDGARGELTAHFTPVEANRWNVDFRFRFDGEPHVYSGTAEGNLKDGMLRGTVKNESGRRTFTFDGEFRENGEFRGKHAETTSGRRHETGTLTLRR
jgi:hypothetical protein